MAESVGSKCGTVRRSVERDRTCSGRRSGRASRRCCAAARSRSACTECADSTGECTLRKPGELDAAWRRRRCTWPAEASPLASALRYSPIANCSNLRDQRLQRSRPYPGSCCDTRRSRTRSADRAEVPIAPPPPIAVGVEVDRPSRGRNSSTDESKTTPLIPMPSFCSALTSSAERGVPYDSPKRNFGEFQRLNVADVAGDELRERALILIDAEEVRRLPGGEDAAESRRGRVDEDEIAAIEQRVLVVDEIERRVGRLSAVRNDDAYRAERTHAQPNRRTPRTAVVEERHRTRRGRRRRA